MLPAAPPVTYYNLMTQVTLFCPAIAIQIPCMGSNHYLCEPVNLATNYT